MADLVGDRDALTAVGSRLVSGSGGVVCRIEGDASGCGSSRVATAVAEFVMRLELDLTMEQESTRASGQGALDASGTFEHVDRVLYGQVAV